MMCQGLVFPLCSDPEKELPKHLASLAKKGKVTHLTTLEEIPDDEELMIRLLCLKKRLCGWFLPMLPISNHSQLTQWLYSVPFPGPSKDTSWIQKSGQFSLIMHVTHLIAKDCLEVDTDWSRTATESGINDLKKVILFQHGNQRKWIQKVAPWKKTYGNAKLLGLSMPFVDVEDLEYEHVQPDQYIWFFCHPKNFV